MHKLHIAETILHIKHGAAAGAAHRNRGGARHLQELLRKPLRAGEGPNYDDHHRQFAAELQRAHSANVSHAKRAFGESNGAKLSARNHFAAN